MLAQWHRLCELVCAVHSCFETVCALPSFPPLPTLALELRLFGIFGENKGELHPQKIKNKGKVHPQKIKVRFTRSSEKKKSTLEFRVKKKRTEKNNRDELRCKEISRRQSKNGELTRTKRLEEAGRRTGWGSGGEGRGMRRVGRTVSCRTRHMPGTL